MNSIIVFPNDTGNVVFCYPAPSWNRSIEELAQKDVPAGKPYLIVSENELPTDHTFFNAFEADFSNPDGYGIGPQAWFIEQYEAEIAAINAEQIPARLPDDQQTVEEYDAVVSQWEAGKAARIAQLNTQIATQQAEMNA